MVGCCTTASPGSTQKSIEQLRDRLDVKRSYVAKREDDLLKPYAVDMNIATIRVMLDETTLALLEPLEANQFQETDALKRQGFLAPTEHLTAGLIEEAAQRASIAISRRDPRGYDAARRISDIRRMHMLLDLLKTQGIKAALAFLDKAETEGRSGDRGTNRFLAKPVIHNFRTNAKDLEELHPKAEIVRSMVEQRIKQNPSSRILIFTEYRYTVTNLIELLTNIEGVKVKGR